MYTIFTTDLVNTQCPKGMNTKNCPLRKYIESGQELFHVSMNETHLVQTNPDAEKFIKVYNEMQAICNKCKEEKQR